MAMTNRTLSRCRIIIVEDDYYQAHDCKQMLEDAGATVIAVSAVAPDLSALQAEGRIDAALIDINLGQGLSLDFARRLREQAIPFVFLSGYDVGILPEDLADVPCISKPADWARVLATLALLTGRRS
jgi:DNA-binding response OmpR family regulator